MKKRTLKIKRTIACFLMALMLLTMLPVGAFAAGYSEQEDQDSIKIAALHRKMNTNNTSVTSESLSPKDNDGNAKLSPPNNIKKNNWPAEIRENDTIDVYVTSTDMTEEEKASHAIPYVVDEDNVTWYLYQILWTNNPSSDTEGNYGTVMSSDEIVAAAESTEANEYRFNLTEITAEPNASQSVDYCIRYCWTLVDPDLWDEDFEELDVYHVSYDFNLPENITTCYTVIEEGIPRPVEGDGNLAQVEGELEDLAANVYAGAGQNYTVSDFEKVHRDYVGFLVFNNKMEQYTYDEYYEFAGWTVGTGETQKVYEIGDVIPDIEELSDYADEEKNIKFTAKWEKIAPLSEAELNTLLSGEDKLPLNLIVRGDNVSTNNLMVQWTDEDKNEHSNTPGKNTGDIVTIDQDGQIHYRVTAIIDSGFTSAAGTYKEEFADLTITIHIDDKLEFVTDSGEQVTLTVDPGPLKLKDSNWTNISGAQKNGNDITFAVSSLPQDGNIELYFNWDPDGNQAAPINITGLDFKLKDDMQSAQDFDIDCWANISGSLNHYDQTVQNPRFHYEAVWTALYSERSWQEAFPGGLKSPTAFVHALQFMDAKLKDFDLRQDELDTGTAPIIKTSVTAIMVEPTPVTLTPADMTIYMGGDGGYDAVVDENGKVVENTNSLPHPIFKLTAPDGVDFDNVNFINAESGNSWELVPETGANGYYHFENYGNTNVGVRVQYSNENGIVTSDEFDPEIENEVFNEYTVSVYKGDTKGIVTAVASDGKNYLINTNEGKLTVRAVQEDDATSDIAATAPAQKVSSGNAVAVAPAGTTYTLNDTGVKLPDDAIPSLLFDSIIEDEDSTTRTDALKEQASEWLDDNGLATGGTRHYEAKYLDLVDANNGNAWIKASNPVTIYWGYPEGTGQSTDFKLLHFKDLHRDTSGGGNTGFDPADIADSTIEEITVNNNANGISFTVGSGGFSPFVLVWTEAAAPGPDPTPDPDPEPTPDPDEPGIADPDDTGVADWLNTKDHEVFLNGYPDGSFGPDRSMTRAEVAAMFSNLLLDKNVPITTSFSDVAEDAWYADAVNMLASLDMIAGYEDGTFRPDAPITRAEFTAIAMRFADAAPEGENIFSDVHAGDWFYDVVVGSIQYGWIGGYEDGTFRPQNTITRAEVTAITNRMLGRVADEAFIDAADALRSFSDLSDAHWAYYSIMEATNAHDYTTTDGVEEWEALH